MNWLASTEKNFFISFVLLANRRCHSWSKADDNFAPEEALVFIQTSNYCGEEAISMRAVDRNNDSNHIGTKIVLEIPNHCSKIVQQL